MKTLTKFKEPFLFAALAIGPNVLYLWAGPMYLAMHVISGAPETVVSLSVLWWGLHHNIVLGGMIVIAAVASWTCERIWPTTTPAPATQAAHP